MNADFTAQCGHDELETLLQLGDAIRDAWTTGCCTNLLANLASHPQLAQAPAVVLDLAYEAYARDFQTGQAPPLDDYVENFPPLCRPTLRTMLLADGLFREETHLLDGPDAPPDRDRVEDLLDDELTFLRPLGSGAAGTVFLAQEKKVGGRCVVVKLSAEGQREATTMGRLADPHVVPVLSAQPLADDVYLVRMPWYGSATLEDVLAQLDLEAGGPPSDARAIVDAVEAIRVPGDPEVVEPAALRGPPRRASYVEQVMDVGMQIALALRAVHRAQYTHCDLKPANVLVGPRGGVFLLDFNLSSSNRPGEPWLGGTPAYMAPEQLQLLTSGRAVLSGDRIDVYSLGVILYRMLTGKHPGGEPPQAASFSRLCREMLPARRGPVEPVRALNPRVDRRAARLVEDCLRPDPAERPHLEEVVARLDAYFSWRSRAARSLRRNLLRVAASLLCLAALGVAVAPFMGGAGQPPPGHFRDGQEAMRLGDFPGAERHFTEALRADPENSDILLSLARAQLAQGKRSAAEANLEAARDSDPGNGLILDYLVYSRANLRQPGPALDAAHKALDLGYTSASLWNNLAYCRVQLANETPDLQQSLDDIRRAASLRPDALAVRYNRAVFTFQLWVKSDQEGKPPLDESALLDMLEVIRMRGHRATGKMFSDAARMSAAVAPSPGQMDRTLDLLRQAVVRGINPNSLARYNLFESLRDDSGSLADHLRKMEPKPPPSVPAYENREPRLMEPGEE